MINQNVFKDCHRHKDDCIAHLLLAIKQLEPRAAFGDQCYQDRCENAYVEQVVLKRVSNERDLFKKSSEDLEQELTEHATERVDQRRKLSEMQEALDNSKMVVRDLDGLDGDTRGPIYCFDCGALVPYGEPCPLCGLGS